jgi:outer membrane immunogenic protein
MKKTFFLFAFALILISGNTFGQTSAPLSKTQLNFGVGFSGWGIPLYIGIDHYVHPDISIGGELSYRSYRENWKDEHYSHNVIGLSLNGNYHFNRLLRISQDWDFYAGLNLGFYIWSSPNDYIGNHSSGLGIGAQIGGRYYFSRNIGLNLEFGGGNAFSGGKLGLSIRL